MKKKLAILIPLLLTMLVSTALGLGLVQAGKPSQQKTVSVWIAAGNVLGYDTDLPYVGGVDGVIATLDKEGQRSSATEYGLTMDTKSSARSLYLDFNQASRYVEPGYVPKDLTGSAFFDVMLRIEPKKTVRNWTKKVTMHSLEIGETTTCTCRISVFSQKGLYLFDLSAGWTSTATVTRVSATEWYARSVSLLPKIDESNYRGWFLYQYNPPNGQSEPYSGNWYTVTFSITIKES